MISVTPLVLAILTAFALVLINRRVQLPGQIVNARGTKTPGRAANGYTMLAMSEVKGVDDDDEDEDDLDDSG